MSSLTNDELLGILDRAASANIGVVYWTNDIVRFRARLYKVKNDSGRSDLARLQLRVWPEGEGLVAIVKGEEK